MYMGSDVYEEPEEEPEELVNLCARLYEQILEPEVEGVEPS
jgi:hypothetical protein